MTETFLPFWIKGVMAGDTSSGSITSYTQVLGTQDFTEVVAQLVFDATICDSMLATSSSIIVTPQISANGTDWKDGTAFTTVTPSTTFPARQVLKISEVSQLMRFKVVLADGGGGDRSGGTFSIHAMGRNDDED